MPKVYSLLVGREIDVPDAELARRQTQRAKTAARQPLSSDQVRRVREALEAQRMQADTVLGALDYADQQAAEAAAARAEVEALRAQPPTPAPATPPALGPAPDPGAISFEYARNENGLLRRVTLRAAGYRDTHVDFYRDAAGKMRELRVADE